MCQSSDTSSKFKPAQGSPGSTTRMRSSSTTGNVSRTAPGARRPLNASPPASMGASTVWGSPVPSKSLTHGARTISIALVFSSRTLQANLNSLRSLRFSSAEGTRRERREFLRQHDVTSTSSVTSLRFSSPALRSSRLRSSVLRFSGSPFSVHRTDIRLCSSLSITSSL